MARRSPCEPAIIWPVAAVWALRRPASALPACQSNSASRGLVPFSESKRTVVGERRGRPRRFAAHRKGNAKAEVPSRSRWRLAQTNQPAFAPAASEQPSPRRDRARRPGAAKSMWACGREAVEGCRRRERVQQRRTVRVFLVILKHIDERIAHPPRSLQSATVPAVGPEAPSALQRAVSAARDAYHEATYS